MSKLERFFTGSNPVPISWLQVSWLSAISLILTVIACLCRHHREPFLGNFESPALLYYLSPNGWLEHLIAGFVVPTFITVSMCISGRAKQWISVLVAGISTMALAFLWELIHQNGLSTWQLWFDGIGVVLFFCIFKRVRLPEIGEHRPETINALNQ